MMRVTPKTRYIPKDCTQEITRDGLPGIVYAGEKRAIAYRGKGAKPVWNYIFRSNLQRDQTIDQFFKGIASHEEYKQQRKEEKKNFIPTLKPGDVLYTSWGYEQTNVEFFQVLAVKGKRVTLQEIGGGLKETGFMSGYTWPEQDAFIEGSKPITKIVQLGNIVKIDGVRYAYPMGERERVSCSWYA